MSSKHAPDLQRRAFLKVTMLASGALAFGVGWGGTAAAALDGETW